MPRLTRLLMLLPVIALLAVRAAPAAASSTQQAIFQDDLQLKGNPAGALAVLRSLGVDRVRVSINWDLVAPAVLPPHGFNGANPAAYPAVNWAPYDAIVRDAGAAGIQVFFTLTGPAPQWATGPGMPPGGPYLQWKPSASRFGAFVHAVGRRYGGSYTPAGSASPLPRVAFWSIWNEANYGVDLAPQAIDNDAVEVSPAAYRALLNAAWKGLAATGHTTATDTILIGETAPRGLDHPIGNFSGIKPLRFLRALYCVDSRFRALRGTAARLRGCPTTAAASKRFRAQNPPLFAASGFADHPYASQTNPQAPNVPTNRTAGARGSDPDYADLPQLPALERTLDRLTGVYGSSHRFPIWNTEYGYRTHPPDPLIHLSPATAAYYDNWAEYLSWRQARLASFMQYLLVDPANGKFSSGLETASLKKLATYYSYRMPVYLPVTSARRPARLEVWGCVRPAKFAALDTGQAQQARIQFRTGSRGRFRTIATVAITNPEGYFDTKLRFAAGGQLRIAWSYPSGQRAYSRLVALTIG